MAACITIAFLTNRLGLDISASPAIAMPTTMNFNFVCCVTVKHGWMLIIVHPNYRKEKEVIKIL